MTDIYTEMKASFSECRAKGAPLDARAALTLFVKRVPAAIAMFDTEMRYLAVSRSFLSLIEFSGSPGEVIGRSHYDTFPDMPPHWREYHARVLAGEKMAHAEDPLPRRDGRIDWVWWSMKPWHTSGGGIGGALLAGELITDEVKAKHNLADSEARFRATFENAAVGISHVAPDGRWLKVNEAFCRILGYSAEELLTKSFQDLTHPDDLQADLAQMQQLHDGKIGSYGTDKRYLRKDETAIWLRRTVSCVRKNDGSIDYFVSVIEDVSARKRAEERLHLLMREANHRVKNILGLVQAIARQTAAHAPDRFAAFTERIGALAANQDLLIRNEWRGADVDDLTRAQLAHLADCFETRIAVHGPKLHLNEAAAQAIGLALHELTTNASKYGALSTDAGRIEVSWRLDGDTFAMGWTESNGPTVRPPEHRGFGTTVIDTMVKQALGGEVELDFAPSGLKWHLTCPAANVQA